MNILDVMKERRSIRRYQDKQIDREDLEKIIEAGLYAPNAGGGYVSSEQPSIIDDPTIKNGFYGAPTVCVIFGAKNFLYSIPDTDTACCFVILGYCYGDYPQIKPRKENRFFDCGLNPEV